MRSSANKGQHLYLVFQDPTNAKLSCGLSGVGKVALVTGGSKGIGFAVARQLAAEGARVVVGARARRKNTSQALDTIHLAGHEVVGIGADVSDAVAIADLLRRAEQRLDKPDILVVNAGGPPA